MAVPTDSATAPIRSQLFRRVGTAAVVAGTVVAVFGSLLVYFGGGSIRQLKAVWRGDALYCETDTIDAGSVKWGTWASVPIRLRNISGSDVRVQGIFCEGLSYARPDLPLDIRPREEAEVTLVTLAKALAADPQFTRQVEIYVDSPESTQAVLRLNVTGVIGNAPETEPVSCASCPK